MSNQPRYPAADSSRPTASPKASSGFWAHSGTTPGPTVAPRYPPSATSITAPPTSCTRPRGSTNPSYVRSRGSSRSAGPHTYSSTSSGPRGIPRSTARAPPAARTRSGVTTVVPEPPTPCSDLRTVLSPTPARAASSRTAARRVSARHCAGSTIPG